MMIMMMNHDSPPSVLLGLETISSVKEEQLFWLFWQLAHTLYIIKTHSNKILCTLWKYSYRFNKNPTLPDPIRETCLLSPDGQTGFFDWSACQLDLDLFSNSCASFESAANQTQSFLCSADCAVVLFASHCTYVARHQLADTTLSQQHSPILNKFTNNITDNRHLREYGF